MMFQLDESGLPELFGTRRTPRAANALFQDPQRDLRRHLSPTQLEALEELEQFGLTAQHLLDCTWADSDADADFGVNYFNALVRLMAPGGGRNLSAEAAIEELQGLDHNQAWGIAHGLTRDQVIALPTRHQMQAVIALEPAPPAVPVCRPG